MFVTSEFNNSDFDLDAHYSDDDENIPIEEKKFWEYLQKLEERNLFEMNLFQDRTQTLEKMEKESQATIAARRAKIIELDNNIKLLKDSMQGRQDRLTYYQNMLVDSNKQGQGPSSNRHQNKAAVGGRGASTQKPKSSTMQ